MLPTGANSGWGHEVQTLSERAQADISRGKGKSAKVTGLRQSRGQNLMFKEVLPILKSAPEESRL